MQANGAGEVLLIGGVLRYDHTDIWRRFVDSAGGSAADVVVFPPASGRARTYASYALRAIDRFAPFVEGIPAADSEGSIASDYRREARDPEWLRAVREANGVFFVGGPPRDLAAVLFDAGGAPSSVVEALRAMHVAGGVIAGGIPGPVAVRHDVNVLAALCGAADVRSETYPGLAVTPPGWHVDQHMFSPGRFALAALVMSQQGLSRGIGVGADTAVRIAGRRAEIVGEEGALIVDLRSAVIEGGGAFSIRGVRLSYFEAGDVLDLIETRITASAVKREGFELRPDSRSTAGTRAMDADGAVHAYRGVLAPMIAAMDGEVVEIVAGSPAFAKAPASAAVRFRFYFGTDTAGWLAIGDDGADRYTLVNVYLDIEPVI